MRFIRNLPRRFRRWLLGKLNAIDRDGAESFCAEFLVPNGAAVVTVLNTGERIVDRLIIRDKDQCGVAVAPWAWDVQLIGLTIMEKTKDKQSKKSP